MGMFDSEKPSEMVEFQGLPRFYFNTDEEKEIHDQMIDMINVLVRKINELEKKVGNVTLEISD